ncbi:MAG: response regulator [Anaerolineales bacterium]|jgi:CheY-like chemotaxis protein|nr:response regulator [Anaerolineales bacterium]
MPKVMIVEDDAAMLSLLTTLLEMEGFEVMKLGEVKTGAILEQLRKEFPDIILMDVYLRQINGLDLLKVIKQDEQVKTVRVIMSSGMDFCEQCLHAGADAFIMKPYMPEELINQLHRVMSLP